MKIKHLYLFLIFVLAFSGCNNDKENTNNDDSNDGDIFTGDEITSNKTGIYDGYGYEFWSDGGTAKMKLGAGGSFKCEWSNRPNKNTLMRRGFKYTVPQTHQQVGNISVSYKGTWSALTDGVSYLCVYGWFRNPSQSGYNQLVEYYIIDDWGIYNRPANSWEENVTYKGTISVDGGTYDIYTSQRTNKPSIDGNKNFMQYWSVRTARRVGGIISVSEHFKKWESLGMPLQNLYEVSLTIEGFNSTGTAEIKENIITIK
ncbi:MAG: glycoside hydrolase family 11 protein [Treponema sp.]|nr:glycoside hydrolase family 11 protein [Treponema sp.]